MKASRKSTTKVIRMLEPSGRAMKNTPPHMSSGKKGGKKMPTVKTKKGGKGSKKKPK